MVGDVNVFFSQYIEENEAELSVMVVDKNARNKGIATSAISAIIDFTFSHFNKNTYIVKINHDNKPSIQFFNKLSFTF